MTGASGRGWALVTGASTGIGADIARILGSRGYPVLVTARSGPLLEELAAEIRSAAEVEVRVLPCDLSAPGGADALADRLEAEGLQVEVLVNNAGFGQWGPWVELDGEEEAAMVRLNVAALTRLTRRIAPGMVARGSGRVLNVASTAGFLSGPLMTVYYATKAYVISFSEALGEELRSSGVTVTCLCPGPVRTEFQRRAAMEIPAAAEPALLGSAHVARAGVDGMLRGRALVIPGWRNVLAAQVPRFLPRWLVPKLVRSVQARRTPGGEA